MEKNREYIKKCMIESLEKERSEILECIEDKEKLIERLEEEMSPENSQGIVDYFRNLLDYRKKRVELTDRQKDLFKKINSKIGIQAENIIGDYQRRIKDEIINIEDEITKQEEVIKPVEGKIILKTLSLHGIKKQDIESNGYWFHFDYNSYFVGFVNQSERLCGEMYRKPKNKEEEKHMKEIERRIISFPRKSFLENKEISNIGYKRFKNISNQDKNLKIISQFYEAMVNEPFREGLFEIIKNDLINNFKDIFQQVFNYRSFILYGSPSKTTKDLISIAHLPLKTVKKIQDDYATVRIDEKESLEDKLSYNLKK
ncbi:MAG: hypothetical protein PHV16_00995 [Candidatus Nanoarchaeia archaeon]|nr:hypothetical protein [Candidatus Nanoarchaeia archaeon]